MAHRKLNAAPKRTAFSKPITRISMKVVINVPAAAPSVLVKYNKLI